MLKPVLKNIFSKNAGIIRKQCLSSSNYKPVGQRRRIILPAAGLLFGSSLAYDGIVNDFEIWGGIQRLARSSKIALQISIDYSIFFWKYKDIDEDNEVYCAEIRKCHQRSANRLLEGCLKNGGSYIKIGKQRKFKLWN